MKTYTIALISLLAIGSSGCDKQVPIAAPHAGEIFSISSSTDNQLARTINIALAEDKSLPNLSIMISVKDRAATLTGLVESQAQHDQAILLASGINGITSVEDRITIRE